MKRIFHQANRLFRTRIFTQKSHLRANIRTLNASKIYTKRVFGVLFTASVGYGFYTSYLHTTTNNSFIVYAHDDDEYEFPTKFLKQVSKDKTGVVLVACGSFNPPTYLHLRLFEEARDTLEREKGYEVIGAYLSPVHQGYGKKGLESAKDRLKMCELATEDSDWVTVDPWEILQPEYSRTRVVLEHFSTEVKKRQKYPENVRVMLLCGADLVKSFTTPNLWKDEDLEIILRDHGLVVMERIGVDLPTLIFDHDILSKYSKNITIVPSYITNNVSSTKIRTFLKRGYSVRYCIPDKVIDYIKEHKLYQK